MQAQKFWNMNEFVKRTLSGAVFVTCVVCSILWNEWAFAALFMLFSVIAVDEFHRLVGSPRALRVYAASSTILLWTMVQCMLFIPGDELERRVWGVACGIAYLLLLVTCLLDEIWNHSERPLQNWGNMFISQFMIAIPLCTLSLLLFLDKWLLLALFVLIWVNDTGAYCVGSLTAKRKGGNHKMTPHISPKKSWEGLFGGIAFTIGAAFILDACGWFASIDAPTNGWVTVVLFAVLVSAFGTMGDLMESLMKRSVGVKDSGRFLPGHGGALDRFDSILLASPILTSFSWLCYLLVPLL